MIVRTLTVVTLLLTAACAGESAAPTASAVRLNQSGYGATVNTELAALRRATAAFHNPSTAAAASDIRSTMKNAARRRHFFRCRTQPAGAMNMCAASCCRNGAGMASDFCVR